MKERMRRATPLLFALLLAPGCARPPPSSPQAAYEAFATALRRGDARTAYASLSRSTQDAMTARSRAISEASGGVVRDEPALAMFQSGTRPAPLGEVTLVEESAGRAVLEVSGVRVRMIQDDGGRWAVDLSDLYAAKGGSR
jgi:hypothetical protein